ncbi:MAG TPA: GSCFA domain-containing protein [Tenuifilaceae bacterium]|nr:GSCFA domain-containing protein [Tenuifilaceae bacterium]
MDYEFRTAVNVKKFPFNIGYNSPVLFLGSCFTENVGGKMQKLKFPALVNPFGVIYNPISVGMVLKRIIAGNTFEENELDFHNNLWFSFMHHTTFSSENKDECLQKINSNLQESVKFCNKTEILAVTFGTARVYIHKGMKNPVANCHKIPAKEFDHKLLTVNEIVDYWTEILEKVFASKPNLKILFTVSPIRHWKDGPEGNQVSKSTLILAVHKLAEHFPENVFYFPAYEIMMDELRDYRFYKDDMLHPSDLAISYIWEKFKGALISPEDQKLTKEIEKIVLNSEHKPIKINTKEHQKFVENTLLQIERILKTNPSLNFSNEIELLQQSIS